MAAAAAGRPYGVSEANRTLSRGREREQGEQVGGAPPGRVEEEAGVRRRLGPDPGEVGDRGVGEDQGSSRVALGEAEGVSAQAGDPSSGVHDDRRTPLSGQREDLSHRRIGQQKALRPWVELDTGRAAVQRTLHLGDAVGVRVDAAERDQPAVCVGGARQHQVVRGAIAAPRGQRKGDRARSDHVERAKQFGGRQVRAVGI